MDDLDDMHPIAVAESRAQQVRHRKVHKIHLEKSFWPDQLPPSPTLVPVICWFPLPAASSRPAARAESSRAAGQAYCRPSASLLPVSDYRDLSTWAFS
jgi:hypothetical protein